MLGSSYSKKWQIVNFPMIILFYRLDFEKLFRILDLLNKLYLGKGLNFIGSLKVRVWRTFDKNEANVNSKASFLGWTNVTWSAWNWTLLAMLCLIVTTYNMHNHLASSQSQSGCSAAGNTHAKRDDDTSSF